MPYETATNKETGEKLINIDGSWQKLEGSATNDKGEKAYQVGGKWLVPPKADTAPKEDTSDKPSGLDKLGPAKEALGLSEGAAHLGSQMAAFPVAAGASAYKLATAPWGDKARQASQAAQSVQQAMTYEPKSQMGKAIADTTDTIGSIPGRVANWATEGIAENEGVKKALGPTGSEYLQAGANTAIQAIPAAFGARAGAVKNTATSQAAKTAESFVRGSTRLDWASMPSKIKNQLIDIAKEGADKLKKLKPEAIERQVRFEKQKIPATRGQIDRDVAQITSEENVTKTPDGKPIANINAAQDKRLHEMVDEQIKATGSKSETRQGFGKSLQDEALRAKRDESKRNYDNLYDKARKTEPDATVSPAPLYDLLNKNPDIQHLGWMSSWLKKAKTETEVPGTSGTPAGKIVDTQGKPLTAGTPGTPASSQTRGITLNEIHDLRQTAVKVAKARGPDAHYAGDVIRKIDETMDQVPAGASAWRQAIDAFKAHKQEYGDQAGISSLVNNKRSARNTRQVALEDTYDKTVDKGSAESLQQLKNSLLSGHKSMESKQKGLQAWKDLQGETIRQLKGAAAGKRSITGEQGDLQFNSTFLDKFDELDKDGKIDVIFDQKQASKLREIAQTVRDLRTKPTGRQSGSDSVTRALNALSPVEKLTYVPGGRYIAGAARVAKNIIGSGESARVARRAKTPTLESMSKKAKLRQSARALIKGSGRSAQANTITLRKDNSDEDSDN